MAYTRKQWATDFLCAIGNCNPSPLVVQWVVGWTMFETACCSGCAYNLLNTEEGNTPGVTGNCNSVGVKNYADYNSGIQANAKVLRNGLYPTLYQALVNNDFITLTSGSSELQKEMGTWGTGYKSNFAAAGLTTGDQSFSGTQTAVTQGQPLSSTSSGGTSCAGVTILGQCIGATVSASLAAWITNPVRILKLVAGIVIIAVALLGIVFEQPDMQKIAKTVALA